MIAQAKTAPRKFKQSDVGEIPEDWTVVPLSRLISSVEYGSSAKSVAEGRVPVLRMGNLQNGKVDWKSLVFTDNALEIRKYTLNSGDVLFNRTNTIELVGKAAIYRGERPAIFAGYLIRIAANKSLLDSRFLNYVLNTEFSRRHSAKVLSVAVGQANINGQKLKTYPIPLPPQRQEQEAIADALSDTDALIDSLESLIAKKRSIKHGAMQQLLTGNQRLPGFTEKWEVSSLGDVAHIDPENLSSETPLDYKFNYIALEDVDHGVLRGYSRQRFCTAPSRARRKLRDGDVLVSTVRPNLKSHLLFHASVGNWVCSTGFCVVRCRLRVCHPSYIIGHMFAGDVNRQIDALLTGSNYPAINSADVWALRIPIPSYDEQTAIAAILSDMDAEIAALDQKLAKAREIKQGMMQELLTGRIRLQ